MPNAKITSKGQITLPRTVRDQLRVGPGDRVAFRTREDGTVVVEADSADLRDIAARLRPYVDAVGPLTVEQIDDAIGRGIAEDFGRSVR